MNPRTPRYVDFVSTPLGRFALLVDGDGRLCASGFADGHARMERELADGALDPQPAPPGVSGAVVRYFAGDLGALRGIPLALRGTPFQLAVWRALADIPCGETRSYAEVARAIGRPAAVRAVGLANGANPLALVLPCHRVIGSDGSLTGYGGGVERKRWLLSHERSDAGSRASERGGACAASS
ncbi:MAG: methylated-DNA--[protein]-cysteine S-methyltransferase [Myxococcales bacterium]|nr:methylated-DNA--[protein]-cysteine S-methyltransferase [Myxococcales bacterium]